MAKPTNAEIEAKRAVIAEAREQALQAKAETIRVKAHNKAENIRRKADAKAKRAIAKGEAHAAKIRRHRPRRNRTQNQTRRAWQAKASSCVAGSTPSPLPGSAAGIVLICLAHGTGLKWACAVFMTCSLVLFGNSACYHLGDWSPRVTDVLRRIDHMNIFLLIAGTYTPVSFALTPFWRDSIIAGMWICTTVALIIHVIWISAPRWLYVLVYIIFGVSGVAFMGLFWMSPYAGPTVVILLCAGGACYIAGAIVYALRKPDPWPKVFGFHEIFHTGTVAGYACHMVAIYMVIVQLWP